MININYVGRLGNNIFQYAVAALISKKYKLPISQHKPFTLFKDMPVYEDLFTNNHLHINDENFLHFLDADINFKGNIELNGFFQKKDFILKYKNEILDLFNYTPESKDGTFIHLRIGDLVTIPTAIAKLEYYIKSIEQSGNIHPIYISSDSPDHSMTKELANNYGMIQYESNPEETIIFGSYFKNKILSLGTFSWWIGFLNENSRVYFPDPDQHLKWHGDIFCYPEWNKVTI